MPAPPIARCSFEEARAVDGDGPRQRDDGHWDDDDDDGGGGGGGGGDRRGVDGDSLLWLEDAPKR